MSDERPESLAAQAAAWVPPWERASRAPDAAYAAEQRAQDEAGELADDDDDFDPASEGSNPVAVDASHEGPADEPDAGPGELFDEPEGVPVDAPREVAGEDEPDPTDIGLGPELPVPDAIEEAEEREDELAPVVDAPLPTDGDDAGDVFDHAADDDVTDDAEVDLPFTEEVPGPDDDVDSEADSAPAEPAALAPDEPVEIDFAEIVAEADSVPVLEEAVPAVKPASGVPAQARRGRKKAAAEADLLALEAAAALAGDEVEELKPLDDQEMRSALEAVLLVVDEPVGEMQLAQIMEQPTERVARTLEDISARYTAAGHGFDLRRVAGGWRLYTRPEYAPYVERFVLDGQSVRLTQAALETLAVVAYKQPVTRSRISAIRGVNCDGVMRTLVTRGLIEECGTESETGAFLYRTTGLFLEKLGLNSVDQLPPLAPFLPDDVEEVLDASG